MTLYFALKKQPDVPIEVDSITPSNFAGKTIEQIGGLAVSQGNQSYRLMDFFDIKGNAGDDPAKTEIMLNGDLSKVKMIGKGMEGGTIKVEGNAGMHLGAEMIAGRIHVNGSVDAWAAAEMKGGNIQIEGNAGDCLCAGYRGSTDGMTGGRVYIAGNVGCELASHMRKGFIAVKGDVSEMAAARMRGGSIIVRGHLGPRVGVEATGGMVLALGKVDPLLPTYRFSGNSEREFTGYYIRYLKARRGDFLPQEIKSSEKWLKFVGDFSEGDPRTEIYVRQSLNAQLMG